MIKEGRDGRGTEGCALSLSNRSVVLHTNLLNVKFGAIHQPSQLDQFAKFTFRPEGNFCTKLYVNFCQCHVYSVLARYFRHLKMDYLVQLCRLVDAASD